VACERIHGVLVAVCEEIARLSHPCEQAVCRPHLRGTIACQFDAARDASRRRRWGSNRCPVVRHWPVEVSHPPSDRGHGMAQLDGSSTSTSGPNPHDLARRGVVGLEPERPFDPVRPVRCRLRVAWAPPLGVPVSSASCNASGASRTRTRRTRPRGVTSPGGKGRTDCSNESSSCPPGATRRMHRDPGTGEDLDIPQHGALRDLQSSRQVTGSQSPAVAQRQEDARPTGPHPSLSSLPTHTVGPRDS
jgi:hypothetical protein